MKIYSAIIDVEDDDTYEEFYGWLEENENNIEAVSENEGGGSSIDLYYFVFKNTVKETSFLSKTAYPVDKSKLFFGAEKDRLINEVI